MCGSSSRRLAVATVGYAPRATHFQTANFASSVPWRVILSVSAVVPAAMARTGTYRWATKYATPSGRRSRRAKTGEEFSNRHKVHGEAQVHGRVG